MAYCDLQREMFKYFSYASNLLRERILISSPTAQVYGVGKLLGYRLTFDMPKACASAKDNVWLGSKATIRPGEPTDYVYGVVWEIPITEMKNLALEEPSYDLREVTVHLDNGEVLICKTFEMGKDTLQIPLPSPHYKHVIIAGAKQNDLPAEYIKNLENHPDNGTTEIPPRFLTVIEMIKKYRADKGLESEMSNSDPDPLDEVIALFRK